MKKLLLILFGFIPLGIGWVMNWLLITFPNTVFPFGYISIAFLVLWAWLGFISYKFEKTINVSMCLIHLPMFLALALNLYQEIVLGHYFNNIVGVCTQFFYLPILNTAYTLTSWSARLWVAYIAGFFLMCLAYFSGYALKKHRTKGA
ncbi:MAG: hypothetical protein RSG53_06825 [Oscillospiraceae bacterium]